MQLIALKPIRLKTSKGLVEIQSGNLFNPFDTRPFIEGGIATPVTQEFFKKTFERLSNHLRQRNYTQENFARLQVMASEMDAAWESMDYPTFEKVIAAMKQIHGTLRPEVGAP